MSKQSQNYSARITVFNRNIELCVSRVIVPGRTFSRRLIDVTCKLRKPHHKTRVTVCMKEDLKVWLLFMSNYNGTTVIFYKFWSSSATLELFSDIVGGKGKGFWNLL